MNPLNKKFFIFEDATTKDAMRRLGQSGEKILFVVNAQDRLLGSLTDGDIRRWVLAEGNLSAPVKKIYNKKPISVRIGYDLEEIKQIMIKHKIQSVPVVNEKKIIEEVLLWDAVFGKNVIVPKEKINVPVVIMAGGKGTRLDPFTRVLPKPLLPIGEKAIIEIIIEKFLPYGIRDFHVSINHKSRMIKAYFEESERDYHIHYIEEAKSLGTVGGLGAIKNKIKDSVFVSNCDIIIETDYHEIYRFHKKRGYDITIVGSFRHFMIPYGICRIEDGGRLVDIEEKPEHDYLVNTGMYLLTKKALKLIPPNTFLNMTDLIERVKGAGGEVGVFPIDEKSWLDVGQWEEFHRAMNVLDLDAHMKSDVKLT